MTDAVKNIPDQSVMPNITISSLKIIDPDTNEVIADGSSDYIILNANSLIKGKVYKIQATLKNMPSSLAKTVTKSPSLIDYYVVTDKDINKNTDEFLENKSFTEHKTSIASTDQTNGIPNNGTANFEWTYKIPDNVKQKIEITACVNDVFFDNGDNFSLKDDFFTISMNVTQK